MLSKCAFANSAQVDPIVSPGAVSDHRHTQSGGVAWSSSSGFSDLLAGGTTCTIPANHSAYWVPTIVKDGLDIDVTQTAFYYGAFGKDPRAIAGGRIQPPPPGLKMIAGNSKATALQSSSLITWSCTGASQPLSRTIPTSCASTAPPSAGIVMNISFPSCWDGVRLDSSNHKDHMAYTVSMTFNNPDGTTSTVKGCPPTHPVAIPGILGEFFYPRSALGGRLSSDHDPAAPAGTTGHADIIEAWDYGSIAQVTNCLNDPARTNLNTAQCGVITTPSLAVSLTRTGMDVRYVNSIGAVLP